MAYKSQKNIYIFGIKKPNWFDKVREVPTQGKEKADSCKVSSDL